MKESIPFIKKTTIKRKLKKSHPPSLRKTSHQLLNKSSVSRAFLGKVRTRPSAAVTTLTIFYSIQKVASQKRDHPIPSLY